MTSYTCTIVKPQLSPKQGIPYTDSIALMH